MPNMGIKQGIRITVPIETAEHLLALIESDMGQHASLEDELPWFRLINSLKASIDKRRKDNNELLGLTKYA